jgi:N-acetylglucosaminyl-diphospho-decaprenol L-rhamnosyltransferase
MTSLSIIIVNWNSTDYLHLCLDSVYRETKGISVDVIVVDNASHDDSCAELIRTEFPKTLLYRSKENLGFARGSNLGYELSHGDYLLFLNPDTEIHSDVFTRMASELGLNKKTGAVGSRLINSDGSLQSSCIRTYPTILNQLLDSELLRNKFPTSQLWGMRPLFVSNTKPVRVDVISGACLMIKREVFLQVGKFDDKYFMYVEDIDLCHRVTTSGYAIQYINDCEVVHHGGKSSALQGDYFANLHQQEAILQFFSVTRGEWYSFLYRFCLVFSAVLRLILIISLLPFRGTVHKTTSWQFSYRKWACIFRWAIGLEV